MVPATTNAEGFQRQRHRRAVRCGRGTASLAFLAASLIFAAAARGDQNITVGPSIAFNPPNLTVAPGEKVTWTFAGAPHSTTSNATSGPEFWDSGIVFTVGTTFSHTFTTPGSYPFYCQVHSFPNGTAMNGVITVAIPTPTPTPPATATPTPAPTPTPTANPNAGAGTGIPALGAAGRVALILLLAAIATVRILSRR